MTQTLVHTCNSMYDAKYGKVCVELHGLVYSVAIYNGNPRRTKGVLTSFNMIQAKSIYTDTTSKMYT
jgi:hypothetical protein